MSTDAITPTIEYPESDGDPMRDKLREWFKASAQIRAECDSLADENARLKAKLRALGIDPEAQ